MTKNDIVSRPLYFNICTEISLRGLQKYFFGLSLFDPVAFSRRTAVHAESWQRLPPFDSTSVNNSPASPLIG